MEVLSQRRPEIVTYQDLFGVRKTYEQRRAERHTAESKAFLAGLKKSGLLADISKSKSGFEIELSDLWARTRNGFHESSSKTINGKHYFDFFVRKMGVLLSQVGADDMERSIVLSSKNLRIPKEVVGKILEASSLIDSEMREGLEDAQIRK